MVGALFASAQESAGVLASLGRHGEAEVAIANAEALLEPTQVYHRACLLYERGSVLGAEGNPEGAATNLRAARDLLRGLNPFDQASLTLDLVETLLELGRSAEAVAEARGQETPASVYIRRPFAPRGIWRNGPTPSTMSYAGSVLLMPFTGILKDPSSAKSSSGRPSASKRSTTALGRCTSARCCWADSTK